MITPLNKTTQELSFRKMYGSRLGRSYKKRYSAKGSHVMKRKSSQKTRSVGRYRKTTMRRPSSAALQYARAIMNPTLTGGRIPDSYAQKTATVQLEQEYIVKVNAAGYALFAVSLGPNPCVHQLATIKTAGTNTTPAPTITTTLVGNTSAGTDGYSGTSGLNSSNQTIDDNYYAGIINNEGSTNTADQTLLYRQLFKSSRLVSAGVQLEYSGTDASNQGVLSAAYFDRDYFSAFLGVKDNGYLLATLDPDLNTSTEEGSKSVPNAGTLPFTSRTAQQDIKILPTGFTGGLLDSTVFNSGTGTAVQPKALADMGTFLRNSESNAFGPAKLGCRIRYYPKDEDDIEFKPLYPVITSAHALARQFINGAIVILAENMDSTATFVAKVTTNMECTLRQDSINLVQSSSSPVDAAGIAGAANMWKRQPQIKIGGNFENQPLNY